MVRKNFHYPIHEVAEYIHWSYFFYAWGISPQYASVAVLHQCVTCETEWVASFPVNERKQAEVALSLFKDARDMLKELDCNFRTYALCRLCEANSDGDDLILDGTRLPLLRQQMYKHTGEYNLCLSDFVRSVASGVTDKVGIFASTVDKEMENLYSNDSYRNLMVKTLADRLAEATAERMHEEVRKFFWGYAPDEQLTIPELHAEAYQGIRPAVGYPSLPDQSVNFIIDELLGMREIGITLTEHGAMCPHASVSGLLMAHPKAKYFSVGRISRDQLADYACRRGLGVAEMERYLRHLL